VKAAVQNWKFGIATLRGWLRSEAVAHMLGLRQYCMAARDP